MPSADTLNKLKAERDGYLLQARRLEEAIAILEGTPNLMVPDGAMLPGVNDFADFGIAASATRLLNERG
jgi:hypothetical protein